MIAQLLGITLRFIPSRSFIDITLGISFIVGTIDLLRILWALLLLLVCIGKIDIGEIVLEGIIVLILGLLLGGTGGTLAALGGILIILDGIF